MRNGMRPIHVVWGGRALGIRAGNWPSNHPTQWLDSAPCAAYFACHAEKSYFPGLDHTIPYSVHNGVVLVAGVL